MQQQENMEEFKFSCKRDYESALASVISESKKKLKKRDRELLEKKYEELIDEYMRFCSARENG